MLRGAMAECRMGNPGRLTTDIGPVIDSEAKANIERHIQTMRSKGRQVFQAVRENSEDAREWQSGTFVAPTLIELDDFAELQKEVFGPVLHVVRYNRNQLPELIEQINASGYGLTLGVHTRIDETIAQVTGSAQVGNLYVNRNMVGAVVGVQPFGGEGLSGTGPKARRSALSLPSAGESPGKCAGGDARASGCGVSGRCAVESRIDSAAKCTAGMGGKPSSARRYVRNMAS